MARYFRCSEILSSDLKNVRLVEEADADTYIQEPCWLMSLLYYLAVCGAQLHKEENFSLNYGISWQKRRKSKPKCSSVTTRILL